MSQQIQPIPLGKDGSLNGLARNALAQRIKADLDQACVNLYSQTEPRTHLGASIIGQVCARKTWYGFRWFQLPNFSGRMLRLFNRGHREEERFITWMRAAGFQVWDVDPNTNEQFRIVACSKHFGGSLDGIGALPYPELVSIYFLCEFKTHNDKSFKKLVKDTVKVSKPEHFRQMSTYGRAYGLRYAIYIASNKNDDDLHIEVIELDWSVGDDMAAKGADIIAARVPPPRISMRPDLLTCKHCEFLRICFYEGTPAKNCRSCMNSYPVEDGKWHCAQHNAIIPDEVIPVGCDYYSRLA